MRFPICLFLFLLALPSSAQKSNSDLLKEVIDLRQTYQEMANNKSHSQWPDVSNTAFAKKLENYISWQKQLQAIQRNDLASQEKINLDLLQFLTNNDVFNLQWESFLLPLNSEGGFLTEIIHELSGAMIISAAEQNQYQQKLLNLPKYIDQHIDLLSQGISRGKMCPKRVVENCLNLLPSQIESALSDESVFLQGIVNKKSTFVENCKKIIKSEVLPAYQRLQQFLKHDYLTAAPTEIGISQISDGEAFYEQRVRYFTTMDISPDEIYDIGEREVERIQTEMKLIISSTGFEGSFADFLNFLRTEKRFYANTGEELLERAAWIAKKMEGQLPKYFNRLPRMPFTIKPVADAIAPNYTSGRYSPGSYEKSRAGEYWVNTYRLETRPLYVLPALTLHEAVPGHHLQIMLAKELENVPNFRKETYLSAFGEGWALYTEWLGLEAGMYEDPYENFGRLTYEMWRACRLVVDVGIHYKEWTRQEAIDFMAKHTALSMHEVNTEIDRYIGWPAQALSYKMGELKIKELRKKAEQEMGGRFDIRTFHDTILENGSVLMSSLERIVDAYIKP